jgi:hypothetical protein
VENQIYEMEKIIITIIIIVFIIYVLAVILYETLSSQNKAVSSKRSKELIDVSDLSLSEEFTPQVVGVYRDDVISSVGGLGLSPKETQVQPIQRVTGALFAQGFEVNKIDKNFRSGNGAIFTGVKCS